jgi:sporulation protein YlmC with PRC-barrel domain
MYNTTRSTGSPSARLDSQPRPVHVGASSLLKNNVYDAAGKRLARIDEIILDARTGSVRFVVLVLGGFLGIGRERFAVPWHVLAPDIDDGRCIVDMALLPFMAVSVPEDDRWLQRTARTRGAEIPHVMQLLQQTPRT